MPFGPLLMLAITPTCWFIIIQILGDPATQEVELCLIEIDFLCLRQRH